MSIGGLKLRSLSTNWTPRVIKQPPSAAKSPFYLSHAINSTRFNAWHILLFVEQRSLHDCRNICLIKFKRKLKILRIIFAISKPSEYVYTAVYNTVMDHVLNWKPCGNIFYAFALYSIRFTSGGLQQTSTQSRIRKFSLPKVQMWLWFSNKNVIFYTL